MMSIKRISISIFNLKTALKIASGKHSFILTTNPQMNAVEQDKYPSINELENGIIILSCLLPLVFLLQVLIMFLQRRNLKNMPISC